MLVALRLQPLIPTMVFIVGALATQDPVEHDLKIPVIFETGFLDPVCNEPNWLGKLALVPCSECKLNVTLQNCTFPNGAGKPNANQFEMRCSMGDNAPHVDDVKLHCPELRSMANCRGTCNLSFRSSSEHKARPKLLSSLGNSIPGIAGGVMALVILAFLIYIVWRIRKRNQERDARLARFEEV